MLKIAGCLAVCLCLPIVASAQQTVSQEDHDRTVRQLQEARQQRQALQTTLNSTRLQQLASVVSISSQGQSSLPLDSGVSANPQLGRIPRRMGQGSDAFITVYAVSAPRSVRLAGQGEVQVLGAVRLLAGARPTHSKAHCEAGQYLLVLRPSDHGTRMLCLLDVQVDGHGALRYREALQVPVEQVNTDKPLSSVTKAAFPNRDNVSQEHPAWQVMVELPATDARVRFRLDMDITML